MAENDIEKISNIDKISQENSGENKLKKQEKTKTTKTTTRKSTTKKSSTTTSNSAEKNTLKVTTSKAKTSKTTANSTTKKSTKTSSNKIKKEDSAKEPMANDDLPKKTTGTSSKAKSTNKSTAKKNGTKSSTKKDGTANSITKKGNTTKTSNANKINKSKTTKKSKKTDDRIKQIINEQLNNVDKFEEVKEVPAKKKKDKKKIDEKQIEEQIETAKKMPKDEKKKIYKKVFSNIILGIVVTLYFIGIGIGFLNIEGVTFITDLKVFSLSILAIAIILFEFAYGKEDDKTALYGVEMLFVAIMSLVLLYTCILHKDKFIAVANIVACIGVLYYLVKSISIYIREKLKWKKTISDVKEIVAEE